MKLRDNCMTGDTISNRSVHFLDAYNDGTYRYFSSIDFNGLFRQKIGNIYCEFISFFEKEDLDQVNLHRRVFFNESSLFFIPYRGRGISEYNLMTKEMNYFPLFNNSNKKLFYYSQAHLIEDGILLVPENEKTDFIIFYLKKRKCKILNGIWESIKKILPDGKEVLFDAEASLIINNCLVLVPWGLNYVLKVDWISGCVSKNELTKNVQLRNIYYDERFYWFTLLKSYSILRCNLCFDEIIEYKNKKSDNSKMPYMCFAQINNMQFVLPCTEKEILRINEQEIELDAFAVLEYETLKPRNERSVFIGYETSEDQVIVLYPCGLDGMYLFNSKNLQWSRQELFYSKELIPYLDKINMYRLKTRISEGHIIVEGKEDIYNLKNFLDCLEICEVMPQEEGGKNGMKIWKMVKP